MLEIKEIVNRDYVDGKCVNCEVLIEIPGETEDKKYYRAIFEKLQFENLLWKVTLLIFDENQYLETISLIYEIPRPIDGNILMIVASGLFSLQMKIKDKVQTYSLLDFSIGDMIKGL